MGLIGGRVSGAAKARLRKFISDAAEAPVEINDLRRLPGGAIQENWLLDISVLEGGARTGDYALVLRLDAPSSVAASHGRAQEYALLKTAHRAGVAVPKPYLLATDPTILGGPFFIMNRIDGTAQGHKLVKRPPDDALAASLGRELARIHAITPDAPAAADLGFLTPIDAAPALAAVGLYRRYLDDLGQARPALEWGLRWLELNAPPVDDKAADIVLCHRDFRTGNYMVSDAGELTGILDWEFAGWGEAEEDIGWFCAKCWRFGAPEREAGGIADRKPFYDAYEQESGRRIDTGRVAYWEVMAHVRWAVIACQQAARHVSAEQLSLELALTQNLVPELELEVLRQAGGRPDA
ncbi:MAG: phosphotransferase family protein [Proteobacteria bacterium]|nr:phosphotransferase family protein [Pseudomonadota bacterium]